VICTAVVAREARARGLPVEAHYAHLLVHGLLHLQGMDHEDDADARAMERREARILQRLGVADPYEVPADP
jgi:probable rRNA maturation factor